MLTAYQYQYVEMSCPAQAPHNKYIVGPTLSQHYCNYTPAHRRSIAAQPAWVVAWFIFQKVQ